MKKRKKLYSYQNYNNLYLKNPLSKDKIKELNLYSVYLTDSLNDKNVYYKYRFPVLFWEKKDKTKIPTLFCELTINSQSPYKVIVDCKKPSKETYAYFYCTEITTINRFIHPMLIQIHKTIQTKLKELGIVHGKKELKGEKNDNKRRIQKTRKTKMGNPIPNKQIQRRNTGNRYTSKRRKFSGKMLQN